MNIRPIYFAQIFIVIVTFFALVEIAFGPMLPSSLFDFSALTGAQVAESTNYKFYGEVTAGTSTGSNNYDANLHVSSVGGKISGNNYDLVLGAVSTVNVETVTGGGSTDNSNGATSSINIVIKQDGDNVISNGPVDLGKEVIFSINKVISADSYLWYFGDVSEPWGTIQNRDIGGGFTQPACQSATTEDVCTENYHGIGSGTPNNQPVGTPCVCADSSGYNPNLPIEYNLYPNNVVETTSSNPISKTFTSFKECNPNLKTPSAKCEIKLVTKTSNEFEFIPERVLVLSGLPGDIGGVVDGTLVPIDGELTVKDSELLYRFITLDLEDVEGNPNCDGEDGTTINDYVLLVDRVSEEESCKEGK